MVEIGMPMLALEQTWSQRRAMHLRNQNISKQSTMDRRFIDEVITAHNKYRSHHQVPPLSHSPELSSVAQKWAEHLAATNSFQHSNNVLGRQRLGENIAMKWSSRADTYTGEEVTDQWYSEVKMYEFGSEPRSLNSGHFTQLVWKASRQIGVGKAQTRDGKVLVVTNYLPAGNIMGEYTLNVFAPRDGKIVIPAERPRAALPNNTPFGDGHSSRSRAFEDFDDMRRGLFSGGDSVSTRGYQSGGESRSTRTYTVTEGQGPNKVTKVIEEETIIKPDGSKITNRKETVKNKDNEEVFNNNAFGGYGGGNDFTERFNRNSPVQSVSSARPNDTYDRFRRFTPSQPYVANVSAFQPQTMHEFTNMCLRYHNLLRNKHGVPDLRLSQELNEHAQEWAEELARIDQLKHSRCSYNGQRLGENLACMWSSEGSDYSGQDVVDQWYSEISKYVYNTERSLGTGHFTQVVWKDSKEIGIGKARSPSGKTIVVANYRPAGNIIGLFSQNVFPPQSGNTR